MIHGRARLRVRIRAKGRRHNAAHKIIMRFAALTEANTLIPLVIDKGLQYACRCMFEALDPAHIADKILAAVALHLSPFLTW